MKIFSTILVLFYAATLWGQQDTASHIATPMHSVYAQHSIIPTVSIGFIDGYRNNYTLPSGFEKNNTSGFAPILVKLEYGFGKNISLAGTFCYDAFIYNYSQVYQGNNGPFVRYRADDFRAISGGVTAFYHLRKIITVKNLDPFIGVGLSLSNNRYSVYPQGDTLGIKLEHIVVPYLKVGARYYISDRFSLYGDLGYEKPCLLSLGFSCRFFSGKKAFK